MAKKYRAHVNIYSFGIVSITYQGIPLYNVQGEAQRILSGEIFRRDDLLDTSALLNSLVRRNYARKKLKRKKAQMRPIIIDSTTYSIYIGTSKVVSELPQSFYYMTDKLYLSDQMLDVLWKMNLSVLTFCKSNA